jgi:hypothetical protein
MNKFMRRILLQNTQANYLPTSQRTYTVFNTNEIQVLHLRITV